MSFLTFATFRSSVSYISNTIVVILRDENIFRPGA